MSEQATSKPKRRLVTRVLRTTLLLLALCVLSSGPAEYGVSRGWLVERDYRIAYGALERVVSRSPFRHAYAWYHNGWVEFAGEREERPQRYSRAARERREQDPFGLPPIAAVSVPLDPPAPRLTVVHIADWHFVPFEVFAADERFHDPNVSDEELEQRYSAFLAQVEAVQAEQRIVLEHLVAQHDLGVAYVERVTDELLEPYKARAKAVDAAKRELLEEALQRAERDGDATTIALAHLALEQHRADHLDTGVVGMLWAEDQLNDVRAAEDTEAHAAANPVQADGNIVWDEAAQARREQATAQRLLAAREPLVAVILGGRHDLRDELAQAGDVRLVRVEVRAWQWATAYERP